MWLAEGWALFTVALHLWAALSPAWSDAAHGAGACTFIFVWYMCRNIRRAHELTVKSRLAREDTLIEKLEPWE